MEYSDARCLSLMDRARYCLEQARLNMGILSDKMFEKDAYEDGKRYRALTEDLYSIEQLLNHQYYNKIKNG